MAVTENYRFNLASLERAEERHQTALASVSEAHTKALAILREVQDSENWSGLQRDEFESFLTLIVAVHGDLIGASLEGHQHSLSDEGPYPLLVNALTNLVASLETFTTDSSAYRELNNL